MDDKAKIGLAMAASGHAFALSRFLERVINVHEWEYRNRPSSGELSDFIDLSLGHAKKLAIQIADILKEIEAQ